MSRSRGVIIFSKQRERWDEDVSVGDADTDLGPPVQCRALNDSLRSGLFPVLVCVCDCKHKTQNIQFIVSSTAKYRNPPGGGGIWHNWWWWKILKSDDDPWCRGGWLQRATVITRDVRHQQYGGTYCSCEPLSHSVLAWRCYQAVWCPHDVPQLQPPQQHALDTLSLPSPSPPTLW